MAVPVSYTHLDVYKRQAFNLPLAEVSCVSCGQCIVNCPTGALVERDQTAELLAAINDPEKYVVVQTAPSIRATLGLSLIHICLCHVNRNL